MCTIMTIDRASFSRKVRNRIWSDGAANADGMSLILFNDGEVTSQLRTMDTFAVLTFLDTMEWDRMFLHSRLATQGDVSIPNTHGWHTNGVYYMHNGFISDRVSDMYEVDSQAIGHWLRRGGIRNALNKLSGEVYANVFLIDSETWEYTVHRSKGGSLFTDGYGNYSTNAVGRMRKVVPDGEQVCYDLPPMHYRPVSKPNATDTAADATVVIPPLTAEAQPLSLSPYMGDPNTKSDSAVLVQRYDAQTGLPLLQVTSTDLIKKVME